MRFFDATLSSGFSIIQASLDLKQKLRRVCLWSIVGLVGGPTALPAMAEVHVTLETTLGNIVIAMDDERACLGATLKASVTEVIIVLNDMRHSFH